MTDDSKTPYEAPNVEEIQTDLPMATAAGSGTIF